MQQNTASDQDLHGLLLIQQFLDTSKGSKMEMLKDLTSIVRSLIGVQILRVNMVYSWIFEAYIDSRGQDQPALLCHLTVLFFSLREPPSIVHSSR